jgi:hypothetical protein
MHVHRDRVAFVSLLALSVAGPHIASATLAPATIISATGAA